ncbi:unnamed protein product, partial [Effrenium voratum]
SAFASAPERPGVPSTSACGAMSQLLPPCSCSRGSPQRLGPLELHGDWDKVRNGDQDSVSPKEKMLLQVMDRLSGIDLRGTFDLDGTGMVSTAVLRRSLATFDPQVFSDECLDLLLRPSCANGERSVHILDVFGPFWQPFCHRLQQLQEKVAQTKRQAQKRQVQLAQTAQDTTEELRAQLEMARQSRRSGEAEPDRQMLELRGRLLECEQEKLRLEEQLAQGPTLLGGPAEVTALPKGKSFQTELGNTGLRRKRTAWREESDTTDLAQQLLKASEQNRKTLEAEVRKALGRLEQVERENHQLQQELAAAQTELTQSRSVSAALTAAKEELAKCQSDKEAQLATAARERQEVQEELARLEGASATQREAFQQQQQRLQEALGQTEDLRAALQQSSLEAELLRQQQGAASARLAELDAESERRRRSEEAAKAMEARVVQLEEEVVVTRETMAAREREAVEAVHHAVARTRAEAEEQMGGHLGGLEAQLQATATKLQQAEEDKEELTGLVGQVSTELKQLQRDLKGREEQVLETRQMSSSRLEEQRQQLLEQTSQRKELADRHEFLSGDVIRLKLEKATLEKQLVQQSADAARIGQENKALEEKVAKASRCEAELKAENQRLQQELQWQQHCHRESQKQLEAARKETQEFALEVSQRGGLSDQSDQLADLSCTLLRLEERLRQISAPRPSSSFVPSSNGVLEFIGAEAELRASQTRLAETSAALAKALGQLEAMEAKAALATDLATELREVQEQLASLTAEHSEKSEQLKRREEELAAAKSELACKEPAPLDPLQKELALGPRKESTDAKPRCINFEDADNVQGDPSDGHAIETEREQLHRELECFAEELLSTLEGLDSRRAEASMRKGLPEQKAEVEATKQALATLQGQIATFSEHLLDHRPTNRRKKANDQKGRGSANHSATAFHVVTQEHSQLQIDHERLQEDLQSLTEKMSATQAELEDALEAQKRIQAEKQALEAKLAESESALVEAQKQLEQKGREAAQAIEAARGETAQERSASEGQRKALEEEKAALLEKLKGMEVHVSDLGGEKSEMLAKLQSLSLQLSEAQTLRAEECQESERTTQALTRLCDEMSSFSEQLAGQWAGVSFEPGHHENPHTAKEAHATCRARCSQVQQQLQAWASLRNPKKQDVQDDALQEELAKERAQSAAKLKERDAKIKALQEQMEEVSHQLSQAQTDLAQEQLDAADALVDAGEDLTVLEWESGAQNRRLEARLAEMEELSKNAEETVESLTQELAQLKAESSSKLAENENKRKEVEYFLEDTAQQLAQAQADADQRALDAATALAAASEESAREKARAEHAEAEVRRLQNLLEDSDASPQFESQFLLPQDRFSRSLGPAEDSEGTLPPKAE